MTSTIASPQIDPQDSNFKKLQENEKQQANKRGENAQNKETNKKDENLVKSVSPDNTVDNNANLGTNQDVVTTNPILKPQKNKKSAKKIAGNVLLALAAGATAVTPVVVYYKNKKYEVVVESEVDNFTAYSITVKRGETISNLKKRLNEFVGHNLVGIYKDSYCTIPFSDSDKVTKNTKVYLKYERIKYVVTMPESLEHCDIFYTTSEDLSAIEWGTKFSFVVKLKEDYQNSYDRSNIQVLVNGVAINPDAVWNDNKEITYTIDFVDQDLDIEVAGLTLNKYALELPSSEEYSFEYDNNIDLTKIEHGSEFKFKVNPSEEFSQTIPSVFANGEEIEKDNEGYYSIVVTDDTIIEVASFELNTYNIILPTNIAYEIKASANEVSWGDNIEFEVVLNDAYNQSAIIVKANGQTLEKNATSGKYEILDIKSDINIEIEGVKLNKYSINFSESDSYSISYEKVFDTTSIAHGSTFRFEVELTGGYTQSQSKIKVYVNDKLIERNEYNEYVIENIQSNIEVRVEGVELNKYTVTWVNHDGTVLEIDENVYHGSNPEYDGEIPTKESTAQYSYAFSGWDVEISGVESDITLTAVFTELINQYVVTWVNYDGTELLRDRLNYGTIPNYEGVTPTKSSDYKYNYSFAGWDKEINEVVGNITYTAIFSAEEKTSYVLTIDSSNISVTAKRNRVYVDINAGENVYEGERLHVIYNESDGHVMSEFTLNDNEYVLQTGQALEVDVASEISIHYSEVATCGLIFEKSANGLYYSVVSYDGSAEDVVIPRKINNRKVTTLKAGTATNTNGVFRNATEVRTVYIPNSITNTNLNYMFYGCSNLERVEFEENSQVTSLGSSTFYQCTSLKTINFGDNSSLTEIGTSSFELSGIESVTIPNTVTTIKTGAFRNCGNLHTFTFEENSTLETMGGGVFANCVNLSSIDLPASLGAIGSSSFSGCLGLTRVVINNKDIYDIAGDKAGMAGALLANAVEVDVLKSIDDGSNTYLNSYKYIKNEQDNYYSYSIAGEYSLSSIGPNVRIEVLRNGQNLTLTHTDIVYEMEEVTVLYTETEGFVMSEFTVNGEVAQNGISLVVGKSFNVTYKEVDACGLTFELNEEESGYIVTDYDGSSSNVIIPSKVYNLPVVDMMWGFEYANGVFEQYPEKVQTLYFPGTIETIKRLHSTQEQDGFALYNLKEVTFGEGVKHLFETFLCCYNSNIVVNLPNTLETIGRSAFSNADITEIEIPESVKVIGDYAFSGAKITSIRLPSGLQSIGLEAFSSCNISEIEIPDGVELVDNGLRLFVNCENLTSVKLPENLTVVGENIFYRCSSLKELALPESVVELGAFAFDDCESLNKIHLSSQLKTIGYGAFSGCSSLTNITIPASVKTIQGKAFDGCSLLKNITIQSADVYRMATSLDSVGGLLLNATEIRVLKSIDDGSNSFLSGHMFIKSEIGSYYSYRLAETYNLSVNSSNVIVIAERNGESVSLYNNSTIYEDENLVVTYIESDGYVMSEFSLNGENYVIDSGMSLSVTVGGEVEIVYNEVDACGLTFTINSEETGYIVTAYDGSEPNIVIPSMVNNLPVIDILWATDANDREGIFEVYAGNVETIYFPGTIESVYRLHSGQDSDNNELKNLREVTFGEGVKHIYDTFECCYHSELTVHLPNTLETIGEETFCNSSISEIEIPDSVKYIGQGAFSWCDNLTSITLPSGLESIGLAAFSYSKITEIEIADGVELLNDGDNLFEECSNLTKVKLPSDLIVIGESMFKGCSKLQQISIPENVTMIKSFAFSYCSKLNNILISANIETISPYAFEVCENLKEITVESSMVYEQLVGKDYNDVGGILENTTTVIVPQEIVDNYQNDYLIGYYHQLSGGLYTFRHGRYKLNVVTSTATNALTITTIRNGSTITLNSGDWLYEGEVLKISYKESDGWVMSNFKVNGYAITLTSSEHAEVELDGPINNGYIDVEYTEVMTYGLTYTEVEDHVEVTAFDRVAMTVQIYSQVRNKPVTVIRNDMFNQCETLTSVQLPSTLEVIGERAFRRTTFTSINLPEGLISIGAYAFEGAYLTNITLPKTLKSIGNNAFRSNSIVNLRIPKSVEEIGSQVFYNCKRLEKVVFEYGCKIIGSHMFGICENLKSVTIPETITKIPASTFDSCESLTSANLPDSIVEIGSRAFCDVPITSVNLSQNLKTIDEGAFMGSGLVNVSIPSSVTTLGEMAFYNCANLTTVNLPNVAINYGSELFYGCSSLKSITLPEKWTTITDLMFYGCSSLSSIKTNGTITSIGYQAFYNCSSLGSFELTEKISSIGEAAFYGCGFTSITVPLIIQSWGKYAFMNCKSLTEVNWIPAQDQGDNMEVLPAYMFSGCSKLANIEIPSTIKTVGSGAFKNCTALREITINPWIETIESSAFYGCTNLDHVYLESSYIYNQITDFKSAGYLLDNASYVDIPKRVYDGKNLFFLAEYEVNLFGDTYKLQTLYANH